jgi:hypothetical protein
MKRRTFFRSLGVGAAMLVLGLKPPEPRVNESTIHEFFNWYLAKHQKEFYNRISEQLRRHALYGTHSIGVTTWPDGKLKTIAIPDYLKSKTEWHVT